MLKLPLGGVYALIPIGIVLMAVFYTYRTVQKIRTAGDAPQDEKEAAV